jgi:hypothetical protein
LKTGGTVKTFPVYLGSSINLGPIASLLSFDIFSMEKEEYKIRLICYSNYAVIEIIHKS